MSDKPDSQKHANKDQKAQELKDEDLKKASGGKKISVTDAEKDPGFAIGPDIPSK